jgi:hypothetical protein
MAPCFELRFAQLREHFTWGNALEGEISYHKGIFDEQAMSSQTQVMLPISAN